MLERQWSLRRERARYEAERARRQYDAVEPENRLVARSLERGWEEKLRRIEQFEQDYRRSKVVVENSSPGNDQYASNQENPGPRNFQP